MAKKSKAEEAAGAFGGVLAVVLMVAAVCIMACVALLPLILLIGAIYCHVRFRQMRGRLRNDLSDFWLTDEEKRDFELQSAALKKHARIIADGERRAQEAGIHVNTDGQYSTRSYLGKEIKQIYAGSGVLVKEIGEHLRALEAKPLKRWQEFNSMACMSKAFRGSLMVWLAILAYYLSSAYRDGALEPNPSAIASFLAGSYGDFFAYVVSVGKAQPAQGFRSLQMIGYSFGGAIVSFLVFKGILRNYGSRFSPKPPEVTLGNLELPTNNATVQKISVSLVPPVQLSLPAPGQLEAQTATLPPPIQAARPPLPAGAPPVPSPRTSRAAIASLVLGIVGAIFPLFVVPILATVFAIVGLRNTRDGRTTGKGMAIAGLTLGAIGILFSILLVISMRAPAQHRASP